VIIPEPRRPRCAKPLALTSMTRVRWARLCSTDVLDPAACGIAVFHETTIVEKRTPSLAEAKARSWRIPSVSELIRKVG
jgi:hypothetical protein